ncbi:carbohydrate ABC transporter permease [Paenibacillus flagellatus]|uniref:ABC transporter permease n=1 Tax=Paenibacillus flagellatus TaxID=2211139 RepID=A0A2V5K2G4_9BACL|nr:sugar ABC transporter permease [Paenibacillus flagellatus]PYI53368.1 ABC transporter permease [Paenibacillus flagellatus]
MSEMKIVPSARTRAAPAPAFRPASKLRTFGRELWADRYSYLFLAPFVICFTLFIVVPVAMAMLLSLTHFNVIEFPKWAGLANFRDLLTQDDVFYRYAIPNTFLYAVICGPGGYALSFLLAWLVSQLPNRAKGIYTLVLYSPSMTMGVAMAVVWMIVFSGDRLGYLNSVLLEWGLIDQPKLWTKDKDLLMPIMIGITLWSSMGVGFLAMLAGISNVNKELYEAGKIDGIRSRLQEIWYITIPSVKPQMLFAAVMTVVGTLKSGGLGAQLSETNPTPQYAGHLILNHIDDYGFIRYEMGYAAAISVVLLVLMYAVNRLFTKLFDSKGEL